MKTVLSLRTQCLALLAASFPGLLWAANCDLQLTGRAVKPAVTANELTTCILEITNRGPGAASSVVVTNWLPSGAMLFSVATSQGTYTTNAGVLKFAVGTLASGAGAVAEVTFFSGTPALLTNRAWGASSSNDPQSANNGATNVVLVLSGTFLPAGQMQVPRWGHTATLLNNGLVLVTGGRNSTGSLASVELFNPASGTSTVVGTMLMPRYLHTATLLQNGKVLIAGHSFEDGMRLWTELFDPASNQLSQTGDLQVARTRHAATLLVDGRVLVTGGIPADTSSAEAYDWTAGNWTRLPSMPASLSLHTSTLLANGEVLLVGGWGIPSIPATVFDPVSNTFAWTGNHVERREGHTATLLADGRVVVIGGGYPADYPTAYCSAEIYDPVTGQFSRTGWMTDARSGHTASWLTNQTLLIVGGTLNQTPTTTEAYDPATGQFVPAAPLNVPRRNHTATSLPDGRTLILGGKDGQDQTSASAELFDAAKIRTPPLLTVEDASHTEGAAVAMGGFQFPVRLSATMGMPVTFQYSLRAGTAWYGEDFSQASGTFTLPPGVTNASLSVAVVNDATFEPDETILLTVSNAVGAVLTRTTITGTILNDDPVPVVGALPAAATESNLLTSQLNFPVVLSNPSAYPVDVLFATVDGSAQAGQDYQAASGVVTFPPGSTNQTVSVLIRGDVTVEPDETFQLQLGAPTNAVLGSNGLGTILNDDGLPGQLHHFSFSAVPSPQHHGQPFFLSINARDLGGAAVNSYNGPVLLRSLPDCTVSYLFDLEQDSILDWFPTNFSYLYGFCELKPFDVTGAGVPSMALRMVPSYGTSGGVARWVELQGGSTYAVRFDAVQQNEGSAFDDNRFNYTLKVGDVTAARLVLDPLGRLAPGAVDRRTVAGSFTPPSNGVYAVSVLLETSFPASHSAVYLDNLRLEAPGLVPAVVTLTNGTWSGPLSMAGTCSNVVLLARDLEMHAGESNPFVLEPAIDVSPQVTVAASSGANTYEDVTLVVEVRNAGPSPASGIRVTDRLPADFLLLSASMPGAEMVSSNGTVICVLSNLGVNASACLTLQTRTGGEGLRTNQVSVTANEFDSFPGNNTQITQIVVMSPMVSIGDVTVTEASGGTNALLTLWLASSNDVPIWVDFTTTNLSATVGADYLSTNGTVMFPPGVTNQTVAVSVLDDPWDESNETFSVVLSNANHALLAGTAGTVTIVDNDPPPALMILDTSVSEGDSGLTPAVFNVTLSAPSEQWVTVYYATSPGTAQPNSDYLVPGGSSSISFEPGQTNAAITIFVRGNTVNEPNETFFVTLNSPQNATVGRAQAACTILNDDAVSGRLDHFVFDPMAEARRAGIAFPVRVSAVDAFGAVVSNYAGSVQMSAPDAANPGVGLVVPGVLGNFNQGVWSGEVAVNKVFTNGTLAVQDDAEHLGQSTPFKVLWTFPLSITLPVSANENAGVLTNAGQLSTLYTNESAIELFLSASDTNLLRVANVVLPAGQTNVSVDLTMVDDAWLNGTRTASISATGPGFATNAASIKVHDSESATLTLASTAVKPVYEGTTVPFKLEISPPPDTMCQVYLSSSDATQLTVPPSIGFSAGMTTAVFNATAVDDKLLDGPQAVTVRAHVENWVDGVTEVTVLDNESTNLSLVMLWQGPYLEGAGTITNFRRVQISGTLPTNLVVQLTSSAPGRLAVPPSITIPAGQTSSNFSATLPDNDQCDGTQNVSIVASAPGLGSATNAIPVTDNDPHHFVFSTIAGPKTSAVPFQVSLSARDVSDASMIYFNGAVGLGAVAGNRLLPSSPTQTNFLRGSWTGSVTVNSWGTNVQFKAMTTNGMFSLSNPFTLVPAPWTGAPAIMTQDGYFGFSEGRFGFNVRADASAAVVVEASTNLIDWLPSQTNVPGASGYFFFEDGGSGLSAQRFYRAR